MTEGKQSDDTLSQQLEDFKKQNPQVAEAMELFGVTLAKYQETLNALYSPYVYQSTSTARVENPKQ